MPSTHQSASQVRAADSPLSSNAAAACIWDATELLLKASTERRDQSLAALWVRGYMRNMVCFPRLNVVSDNVSIVAHHFANVPNVSFHTLDWPHSMRKAGLGHSIYSTEGAQRINGLPASYYAIQWPMMWADNFTVARHVLVLDTDTLPILPLRCHHLFDADERPLWYTWSWPKPPAWLQHVNAVFNQPDDDKAASRWARAHLAPNADFMTFFPVVIPRAVLPAARKAVERAYGCHFDEAWLRIKNPSYGDLIGKAAALLRPKSTTVVHCPSVGRMKEPIPADDLAQQTDNACRDKVTVVEHLKHPLRDCHTGHCHHLARTSAVQYGTQLLSRAESFQRGTGAMPWELFHYQANRSESLRRTIEAQIVSSDSTGRICGVPLSTTGVESAQPVETPPSLTSEATNASVLYRLETPSTLKDDEGLALLVYDNRFEPSIGPLPRHLLYRSAALLGVPTLIGSLVPASVRGWQPGDRELWLMRTLPQVKERVVALLDGFDTVLMCRKAELFDVWQRLAGDSSILISAEKQLWPEEGTYRGSSWSGAHGSYPNPVETGGPPSSTRYINIGAVIGPPTSLVALLRCMSARYSAFPYQCPIRALANGSYDYVSTAPFRTRRIGVVKGAWGWEQACFHTYLTEQAHGALPESCPRLVMDYRADFALNFNKIGPQLKWPWADQKRMRHPVTDVASCLLHANGAGKYAMPVMHYWWDHVHGPDRHVLNAALPPAHVDEATILLNFSRDYVKHWVNALKPQTLRESSAQLMMKDALKTRGVM